jgi:hypothetical protein
MENKFKKVDICNIDKIYPKTKLKELLPRTKQDCLGIIPENFLYFYRLVKKGKVIF